jgi:hypothetical protein
MDFSLSSSLVGSAVSNSDKLALDLQFAADKTLTARKGPTPVFTRGSAATFVGSDGLVQFAPNNLALYSGQLVVGTGWGANATPSVTSIVDGLGPDGNNAYEVAEIANTGTHVLFNSGGTGTSGSTSVVSNIAYTGSIFVKKVAGSVNWIQLTLGTAGFGATQYANFNIANGTIGNFSATTPQIQDAGNGWYRCSVSSAATATTTTTSLLVAFTNNTDATSRLLSYAGSTANKILAAMCQFEIGSTVRPYNQTTTAVFYGPRFDHDPVTLACKGLLIEESRTNAALYSGALVIGTGWTSDIIAGTTSTVDGVGPDGNNAYEIAEITNTGPHSIINTGGLLGVGATSITSGTTYTGSIFFKKIAGSVNWIQLTFAGAGFGTTGYANFNLSTGAIGNSSGGTARIEAYANGWYRVSWTAVATATTTTASNLIVLFTNNTNSSARAISYAGSTANKVLAAMCQFEAGSFATSYIPTVASTVVRSADVCSITGSAFTGFYNPVEGSLFTSVIFNAPTSSATGQLVVDVNDTTTTNRLRYFRNPTTGTSGFANTSGSTTNVSLTGAVLQPFVMQKFSAGFKLNDYAFYANNSQVGIDNLGSLLVSPTTLTIGDASAGSPRQYTNGTISSLRYFKKRLPNAKLQTITV